MINIEKIKKYNVIVGPDNESGEQQYWNIELCNWVTDLDHATQFDRRIYNAPLPTGAEGIMKFEGYKPLTWYPSPIGDNNSLN